MFQDYWGPHTQPRDQTCCFECFALQFWGRQSAPLSLSDADTMRSIFGQKDHMQVFRFVLEGPDFNVCNHLSSAAVSGAASATQL